MLRPMPVTVLLRTLLVAFAILVAGCGDGGSQDRSGQSDPTSVAPDPTPTATAINVTCNGDVAWPTSAMTGGTPKSESGDLVGALKELAGSGGMDAPPAFQHTPVEDADWFVLARDGHAAAVATGPWSATGPGKGAQVVYLDHEGAGWKATGWGDCKLSPWLPDGEQWVKINGVSAGRDTREPTLQVNEMECTSGRDPRPYLRKPTILETGDRVTVSWTSAAPKGVNNCIGSMPVPATVQLSEPLGDRVLYDGSSWPARRVG